MNLLRKLVKPIVGASMLFSLASCASLTAQNNPSYQISSPKTHSRNYSGLQFPYDCVGETTMPNMKDLDQLKEVVSEMAIQDYLENCLGSATPEPETYKIILDFGNGKGYAFPAFE